LLTGKRPHDEVNGLCEAGGRVNRRVLAAHSTLLHSNSQTIKKPKLQIIFLSEYFYNCEELYLLYARKALDGLKKIGMQFNK
jgi:hypothetical protein